MTGIAPPRGAVPAPIPLQRAARAAGVALGAALVFWAPLLLGGPLFARDWASHHWHYFDWLRTSLVDHGTLPLFMADAWVTPNFWANAEAPILGPLVPLLLVLPTGAFCKLLIVVWSAAGLAGCLLLLRDLEVAPAVAALVAALFAAGGFFAAHVAVGHPWALGAYALPWLLLLFRRAALGSPAALWGAALLGALVLLGGQYQPFIWQNLLLCAFAAFWALAVRAAFPLTCLARLWLATAGLAAVRLVPVLAEFGDYDPEARIPGLPLPLLPLSLASAGQHPGLAPQGLAYAHGAGWWEYASYVGVVPLGLVAVGLAAARRSGPLALAGAGFLALAVEWPAVSIGRLLEWLPVLHTQRAPSRFLLPALFALAVAAAPGLDRVYRAAAARRPRAARVAAAAVAAFVAIDLFAESLVWQRSAVGSEVTPRDHRPRPLVVTGPGGVRAELVEFAPNRLVYRVAAPAPATLTLPLRYGRDVPEWRAEGARILARSGRLALDVPAGERDVVLRYRPAGLAIGAAISLATIGVGFVAALRRRRS